MKLLYYPHESLSTPCVEVIKADLDLDTVLDEMIKIMLDNQGMGLSGNQVGLNYRIFVMKDGRGRIWEFINPVLSHKYDTQFLKEGCLSLPGVTIEVPRAKQVIVTAFNRNWKEFKVGCIDIEAVCIQHEMDHLDGKFVLDGLSRQEKRSILRKAQKYVQKN